MAFPIPNVSLTVASGGVGIIVPGVGALPVNVAGWCSLGPSATPTAIGVGAVTALTAQFGVGPAVELAAAILANGAPQGVIVTRIFDGTIASPFTRTGTGPSSTVTASGSPMGLFGTPTATGSTGPIILITTGGSVGTAQFSVSLDGGTSYAPPQATAATYLIPATGLTIAFGAGTYVVNDTYIGAITSATGASYTVVSGINTKMTAGSTVCQQLPVPGGSLTGLGSITMDTTNNPQDAYSVIILISTSGVLGVGQFEYSTDGGLTFSNAIQIPSGGGPTSLGGTSIAIDWSNSGGAGGTSGFIVGESYLFTTVPPSISNTDILNVGEASQVVGSALQWDWMHVVGRPTSGSQALPSIAAGTAIFSTLSTIGSYWFTNQRYSFLVQDTPPCTSQNSIEAALVTAYANLASDFVAVGGGDCNIVSAVSGSETQRCASWAASIWGSTKNIGIDLAEVDLGNLPFVAQILLDQNKSPLLGENRFTAMRTISTETGFFINNAFIMSNQGTSNITYWQSRRVLNQACRIAYAALVVYLSKPILVDSATGQITPAAATAIQNNVLRELNAGLSGQVSGVSCIVNQTNDILTTETLEVTVGVVPLAYPKAVAATIGYVNPAISTQ
jgi:hypothetical protein